MSRYKPGIDTATTTFDLGPNTSPYGVTHNSAGDIFTANSIGDSVSRISASGDVIVEYANLGTGAAPKSIVADSAGDLFTANSGTSTVTEVTASGTIV
ncbi:MAG: hypothetical protein JWQ64_3788, partial [Subtercola sp.]|nr:hypothetical protein [Subtercola sp.]